MDSQGPRPAPGFPGALLEEHRMLRLMDVEVLYMKVILVLRGVSIELPEGGIIALLGANGGGKTTILRAISGLLYTEDGEVTHGKIEYKGMNIANKDPQEIAKMGIIQIMEGRQVLEHLTVEQNLKAGALIHKGSGTLKSDLEKVYDYFPALTNLRARTSGYLSGGEQQMLVIGRALMTHPEIMLLDEPATGLSPILRTTIFDIIVKLNREEKTGMLLSEQNVSAALEISDHAYIVENGRIVLDGSSEKMKSHADVQEFYLGFTESGKRKSYKDVKHYKRRKRWVA